MPRIQRRRKKRKRSGYVALKECNGVGYGLTDLYEAREMNNGCGFVFEQGLLKSFPVAYVALLKRPPLDKFFVSVDQVIKHNRHKAFGTG